MKLTVNSKNDEIVNITTSVDFEGDVVIQANGVEICWITVGGRLLMNKCDASRLKAIGFTMYGNRVEIGNL